MCGSERVKDPDTAGAPPSGEGPQQQARAPDAIAADQARLRSLRESLVADELDTTSVDKKLKLLEKEAAGPPPRPGKLPHNHFEECRKASLRSEEFLQSVLEKRSLLLKRQAELQADIDAADKALCKARAAQSAAALALDAAAAALRTTAEPEDASRTPTTAASDARAGVSTAVSQLNLLLQGAANGAADGGAAYQQYLSGVSGGEPLPFVDWLLRELRTTVSGIMVHLQDATSDLDSAARGDSSTRITRARTGAATTPGAGALALLNGDSAADAHMTGDRIAPTALDVPSPVQ